MKMWIIYLMFFISFICGGLFALILIFKETSGTLTIRTIEGKENWMFILEKPIANVEKSKLILLKVKKE